MKIESITLKDFKCFENLQLQLTKPVSLFFGRNAAGKTSLAQAIALTMTGKVNGNGCDRAPLTRYSANDFTASASVFQNDQQYASTQKASVRESIDPSMLWNMLHTSRETISAVIDTGNFLNLHPDEKKRIIFDLLPDLKMDAASLPGHLAAWLAGKYAFTADELMPLLDKPATMETAYNQAFETRRIAKRDLKAQGAIAKIPEGLTRDHVSSYIVNLRQELAAIHTAMGESKGMAAGEKKQAGNELAVIDAEVLQIESLYRGFEPEEAKRHLVNLQRDSAALTGEIERMRSSFADMQQELGKLLAVKRRQDDISAQAQAFSGFCPLLPVIACKTKEVRAHMTELARPDNTHEQALEQQHEKMTPVRQAIEEKENELNSIHGSIMGVENAIARYEVNRKKLDGLMKRKVELTEIINAADDCKTTAIESLQEKKTAIQGEIEKQTALLTSIQKAEQAKSMQDKIDKLEVLVTAFSPKGIMSSLLEGAASTLSQSAGNLMAALSGNRYAMEINIEEGFDIFLIDNTTGSRTSANFASASERFRIGIVLQSVLSELAGLRFMVIDGIDILDQANRGFFFQFIRTIASRFDQIIGFCTIGQYAPSSPGLPEMDFFMIENGKINRIAA